MAVSVSLAQHLESTANNGAGVAYSTASWTPTNGRGYLVAIRGVGLTTGPDPTVSGNGQTWTKVVSRNNARFLGIWKVDNASGASAGALSVTFSEAATGCCIAICEVTGHDTTGMTRNAPTVANGNGTSGSITMGAFADAGNGTFAAAEHVAQEAMTPHGSMTELSDFGHSGPVAELQTEWAAGNISAPSSSWASSVGWSIAACELIAATSNHNGTLVVTGGGVLTTAQSTNRNRSGSLVGGGVLALVKSTVRNLAQLLTGGGVVTPARTSNRNRTQPLTGGGVIAQAQLTNRNRAGALTGGGVDVTAQLTNRNLARALTGGGILVVAGQASGGPEQHSGAAMLTGGGVISWFELTGRLATIQLHGGGQLVIMGGQDVALTDLGAVMCAMGDALEAAGVTQGRVFCYPPDAIDAPATVVGYPSTIEFDSTMQRGADRLVIPIYYLTGRTSERTAQQKIAGVITGANGVKDALDGNIGGAVQTARVTDMRVLAVELAGVSYLSAVFNVEAFV